MRRCARPAFEVLDEPSVFAGRYRVVRWHGKERSSRLRPLNVRQRVCRFAAPRIRPLAHNHHLQIVGEPRLSHDDDRLFVSDLSGGNRARQPRSLRADSRNRLRAEIFFLEIAGSYFLLLASRHFPLDVAFHRSLHSVNRAAHFLRSFGFGMQHETRVRNGIIDYHERLRLPGRRQRAKSRQRDFLAKSSLAVAEQVHLRLARNVIPVRESLVRFLHGYRAEGRAGHHLAAVQSFKSQQFNAVAHLHEYAGTFSVHHHAHTRARRRRWALLRPQGASGSCQRSSEKQVCEYSSIHYFVSSSLPNCCELFAMAIAANPFFNCATHTVTSFPRSFRSVSAARLTLFQKADATICVLLPEAPLKRPAPHEDSLRQPHRLRQSIIPNEQIHLDPFIGSLFIDWQAQRTQRAALHAHAQNGGVIGIQGKGSGQKRKAGQFIVSHKYLGTVGSRRILRRHSIRKLRSVFMIRSGTGIVLRRNSCRRGIQMLRSHFLPAVEPIAPAYDSGEDSRSGQRPRRHHGVAPNLECYVLRAKLLAQTHLHARRRLSHRRIFRERPQINSRRLPRLLQCGASRAGIRVLTRGHALHFAQGGVALRVQPDHFKFFAVHLAHPLLIEAIKRQPNLKAFFIAPRSRDAARRETFPAWPSAKLARDATANESSRSGIRPFARLPHNSFLPIRTAPRLRESPPANPAQQPAPAACVRAFPPTLLEWTRLAKRFRCPCRLRFSLPAEFPAANVPGVSSRGYEPLHTGRLQALHAWRRTFSDRASRS